MTNIKKGDSATNRNRPSGTTKSSSNSSTITPIWEAISAFQNEISKAGLGTPEIKPDAGIIRFSLPNEKKGKSGWYVFFSDGVYAGKFGSWKTGESTEWHMKSNNQPLTPQERKAFAVACKKAEQKRTDETNKKHRKARIIAQSIWANASPCSPDAPYLKLKKISSCAKYLRQDKHGNILVPIYADKQISSLQFISNKNLGAKWYLTGGKVASAFYYFGDIKQPFETAYIAEGLASAYSCFLLLSHAPVFVSFTASNLSNIAKLVRAQFKDTDIVILADNDVRDKPNEINTGIVEAEKAALCCNGRVSIPSHPSGKKVDFNDLYVEAIEAQENERACK